MSIFLSFVVGALIGGAVGTLIDTVIELYCRITGDVLYEETCNVVQDAIGRTDGFIALIQEKKKNAIKVGIFEEVDEEEYESYGSIEFETEEGIDRNLKKGEAFYL
jgi:hypothetical protein